MESLINKFGPKAEVELFKRLSHAAHEFPLETVGSATLNLALNVVKQQHPKLADALKHYDEITARLRAALIEKHYDMLGRRVDQMPFADTVGGVLGQIVKPN